MARIIWSRTAIDDLKSIANFLGKDSTYYAKAIVNKIYKVVSRLEDYPKSGRMIPEFGNESLRELIVSPYRVFYLFENDVVNILTIVHSKQNV